MAKYRWMDITYEDVIKAIDLFEYENQEYPEPRNTFLIYNGKKYPAKHIRGIAYKIHFKTEIRKSEYSGGMQTVRFFNRLGFEVQYISKNPTEQTVSAKLVQSKSEECISKKRQSIKIGLYLQTDEYKNSRYFKKAVSLVKKSDIDIFVLPEFGYFPFEETLNESDFLKQTDINNVYKRALEFSNQIGKAIIVNSYDESGRIVSVYANAKASKGETKCTYYVKHTMTYCSAFEDENYIENCNEIFSPIIFKGAKIGMTICYDCNHALFSRMYGLNHVDIIINSTGGSVVYDKWYKYNKARAIENGCYTFVTMGGDGTSENPNCYVFGFSPKGKQLSSRVLGDNDTLQNNLSGSIYVFDTSVDDGSTEPDPSCYQTPTVNKKIDLYLDKEDIDALIEHGLKIDDNLYIYKKDTTNIVFALIDGMDIIKPETALKLLYSERLKEYENKKYIIVNRWGNIDTDFFESTLSLILKVRAMENFCAVILLSENINMCFQCGNTRTAQVVKEEKGKFGLDLSRTGGPQVIWRNKRGMRADWRSNFELLVDQCE